MRFPLRTVAAVAVAVLALAGCAATTAGTGSVAVHRAAGTPSTTASSTPTVAQAHKPPYEVPVGQPGSVLRSTPSTIFGDPVTADLCAGVRPSTFRRWGTGHVHWFQSAGRCYYDVDTAAGTWFQLDTDVIPEDSFSPGQSRPRIVRPGGETEYVFPLRGDDCERAFTAGTFVLDTITFARGSVPGATLCAAADAWVRATIPLYTNSTLARRPLAHPSLTRFDLCALADVGKIRWLPNMLGLQLGPVDEGGACAGSSSTYSVDIQDVFIDTTQELGGSVVEVDGHRLNRYRTTTDQRPTCEIMSQQGRVGAGPIHEELDVLFKSYGEASGTETCNVAVKAAVALLRTAGLH